MEVEAGAGVEGGTGAVGGLGDLPSPIPRPLLLPLLVLSILYQGKLTINIYYSFHK